MPDEKINPIKEKMFLEADLLLKSVDFYCKKVEEKLAEIDEASNNNLVNDFPRLEKETLFLIQKLKKETSRMDEFLVKYKRFIQNEKSQMLHNIQSGQ